MEETRSLRDKTARGFLWGGINNGTVQVLGALFGIVFMCLLQINRLNRKEEKDK